MSPETFTNSERSETVAQHRTKAFQQVSQESLLSIPYRSEGSAYGNGQQNERAVEPGYRDRVGGRADKRGNNMKNVWNVALVCRSFGDDVGGVCGGDTGGLCGKGASDNIELQDSWVLT